MNLGTESIFGGSDTRQICFNDKDGTRICEEIPSSEEIKCNKKGICSIYVPNIKNEKDVMKVADKYNLRIFPISDKDQSEDINVLSGAIKETHLNDVMDVIGRDIDVKKNDALRKIKMGDIEPPNICNLNPLSPKCKNYLYSDDWFWMGPIRGWVKSKNAIDAIGTLFNKKKTPKKLSDRNDNRIADQQSDSNNEILTTA